MINFHLFKLSLILIFNFTCVLTTQYNKKLPVGAIFENPNDDAEIAFRVAIENSNINERNFELVPIIKYSKSDDGFILETLACELVAEGVIAIFGSPSSKSGIIAAICHTLEIPHIMFEYKKQIRHFEIPFHTMSMSVHPNDLKLSAAYAAVVQSLSWDRYAIIYESERELIQLQDVLQIHGPDSRPVVIRQLPEGNDYRPFLKNLRELIIPCYIIHCATENILKFMQQAKELNMLGEYQSIFIASLDAHTINFDELDIFKSNITAMRIINPTDFNIKNIIYDWEQHERRNGRYFKISSNHAKMKMFLANDAVLVFSKGLAALDIIDRISVPKLNCKEIRKWSSGRKIINSIKNRTEEGATGRIDFDGNGQRDFFSVQILQYLNLVKTFHEIGTWNAVNGIKNTADYDGIQRRHDNIIPNKVFLVSSRIGEPFLFNRSKYTNETLYGNDRYEGYSMDLIDAIAKLKDFKYKFILVRDKKYGKYVEKTGKWNGIIREVMDRNVDMGICDLTMTAGRRQVVDFTPPFMTLGITLMYAKPEEVITHLFSFVDPFSKEVWLQMGAAFIGLLLLIFITARMSPADWENPHPCKSNPSALENSWNIKNSVWLTIGSLMGQGCDLLPKSASVRIITGMWWFFALMMLNSYTANLAAFLTTSGSVATINSVEELANQRKVKYGVVEGGSTQIFFRDSNVSLYQKMWSVMESEDPSVMADSNDEGEERVVKSKRQFAFFMESSVLEYKIERNCNVMQVGSWLDFKTYGIALPFNSPYRKEISEAVLQLGESGVLADLKRKWWKEMYGGGKCTIKPSSLSSNSGPVPLAINNVGGVFLLVGMGIFIGFIIAIVEFFWNLQTVSVEEKITLMEAFKIEALFALKFWKKSKPIRTSNTSGGESISKRSLKSLRRSSPESELKNSKFKRRLNGSEISMRSIKFLDIVYDDDKNLVKDRNSSCFSLKSNLNIPKLFNDNKNNDETKL